MRNADFHPVANILAVTISPVDMTHLFDTITSDRTFYGKIFFTLKQFRYILTVTYFRTFYSPIKVKIVFLSEKKKDK